MPRRSSPSVNSSASMAEPLSVISARGSPRFWMACDRPCTRSSAVSDRYHCRWQQSREWSSRMASTSGRCHWPLGVSTLREPWWKSRCHSEPTYSASKLRTSRAWRRASTFAGTPLGPGPRLAHQAVSLQVTADRGIRRQHSQRRLGLHQRRQVVVVQLVAPVRMLLVLATQSLGHGRRQRHLAAVLAYGAA